MKKVLYIAGAGALILVVVKSIKSANAFTPTQIQNAPTNYLDSYWSNLKGTLGRLF